MRNDKLKSLSGERPNLFSKAHADIIKAQANLIHYGRQTT